MLTFCEAYYNNFATEDDILRLSIQNNISGGQEV